MEMKLFKRNIQQPKTIKTYKITFQSLKSEGEGGRLVCDIVVNDLRCILSCYLGGVRLILDYVVYFYV